MTRAITSSSNIFRRILCPGSAQLEQGLAEEDSDYSAEGKMLHELYWTTGLAERSASLCPAPVLTESQVDCLETANELTRNFFETVADQFEIIDDDAFIETKEPELIFTDPRTGAALFPGHADLIRRWPASNVTCIADVKTGFSQNDPAPDNYQLASYAVQDWQMTGRSPDARYAVALIQPRFFGTRFSMATYNAEQLKAAEGVLLTGYLSSLDPGAPLVAGEKQCAWCRAVVICPAALKVLENLTGWVHRGYE